jgi:phosphoglucosamine mutase
MGAMVSASHNPAEDNGIKLIGSDGRKLPDAFEVEIEDLLHSDRARRADPRKVGTISHLSGLLEQHIEWIRTAFPIRLDGLRVLADCAHGAATEWARPALEAAGAEVIETGVQPDGLNINAEGGATKPEHLLRATLEAKARVGLAFDGDADRAVFADENGRLVNGDHILALWALHRKRLGTLDPPIVVGTVMSNMGMERLLAEHGITLDRAPVGDRYVVERMDATGALAGGEQSGHIVFREKAPTGDGIVTALEVLQVIAQTGKGLAELADLYEPWPQVLINVRVRDRSAWRTPAVERGIAEAERTLGNDGRLLVRASGTQPMLRVMCEHHDREHRDRVAERVLELLHDEAGGDIYSRVELTDALGD